MDGTALRELQAPLKARYKDDPEAGVVTLRAKGEIGQEHLACRVETGRALVEAGLHPANGGSGLEACSGDMLLEALVACAGVTLRAVATAMGVTINGGSIVAEGVWDVRGTLGVDRSVPVGLSEITLRFDVDSDADPARLARMIQTTERYCVILQTLRNPPKLTRGEAPGA